MKNPLYNWSQIATFKLNSLHKLQKPGWKNLFLRNFFFKKKTVYVSCSWRNFPNNYFSFKIAMLQNNCHQLRLHSLILNQMMLALCLINHCIRMSLKQESVLVSPYYCWLLRKIELQIFIISTQLYCHVICIYLASKKSFNLHIVCCFSCQSWLFGITFPRTII